MHWKTIISNILLKTIHISTTRIKCDSWYCFWSCTYMFKYVTYMYTILNTFLRESLLCMSTSDTHLPQMNQTLLKGCFTNMLMTKVDTLKIYGCTSLIIQDSLRPLLSPGPIANNACKSTPPQYRALRWRHNDHAGVSNHQPHGCLLNRLFRRKSKITSKLRVTGLCVGNSPGTGEFPAQMASYAENVSIWWRHHGNSSCLDNSS